MQLLDDLSYKLMRSTWIPWRYRHRGGPINTIIHANARKRKLTREIAAINAKQPDDITILIGTSNRKDFRLVRALESLRNQDYPQQLIKILVVDYGNPQDIADWLDKTVEQYQGRVIHTKPIKGQWNKPHCMNVGMRQIDTKFMLSSDVDIMFAPNYLSTAIKLLKADPFQVILSTSLDLPEEATPQLEAVDQPVDIVALKQSAASRKGIGQDFSTGISCSYTHFYHEVQGYDQFFERWGSEDDDMVRRLVWLCLKRTFIGRDTYYLHQWHPKHEGVQTDDLQAVIQRNHEYSTTSRAIVANDENWGKPV